MAFKSNSIAWTFDQCQSALAPETHIHSPSQHVIPQIWSGTNAPPSSHRTVTGLTSKLSWSINAKQLGYPTLDKDDRSGTSPSFTDTRSGSFNTRNRIEGSVCSRQTIENNRPKTSLNSANVPSPQTMVREEASEPTTDAPFRSNRSSRP